MRPQARRDLWKNYRVKRIRSTEFGDIIFLKSVVSSWAHVAEHGTSQKKFEEKLHVFFINSLKNKLDSVTPPTWKTIYERFKKVVSDHRTVVCKSQAASVWRNMRMRALRFWMTFYRRWTTVRSSGGRKM